MFFFLCHPKGDVFVQSIFSLLCSFQNWMIRMTLIWMILNMLVSHPKEDVLCIIQIWMIHNVRFWKCLKVLQNWITVKEHSNIIILSLKTIVHSLWCTTSIQVYLWKLVFHVHLGCHIGLGSANDVWLYGSYHYLGCVHGNGLGH